MEQTLERLRAEIDGIDAALVRLLAQRMDVVRQVAAYKAERGLPVFDAKRELALLARIRAMAGEDCGEAAAAVYRTILAESRACQEAEITARREEQKP